MSDVNDRLIEKIRKLLALSRNNSNENEASAAAAKVHELLASHNIEMAQLESDTPNSTDALERRERTPHDRSAMYNYQRSLMETVAETNFCMYFLTEVDKESFGKMRRVKSHVLLSSKVNMAVATMLYDYLVDAMDGLLPYTGMQKRGKDALAWLDGCTYRLCERLTDRFNREKMEKRDPIVHGGNQLVMADVHATEADLNNDAFNGWEPGTTTRHRLQREAEARQRQAAIAEKEAAYIADGYDADDAWHLARGYPAPSQVALSAATRVVVAPAPVKPPRPMTEKQRADAEARQRRSDSAYYARQAKVNARYNNPVFRAGAAKAEGIGLDRQVGRDKAKGLLK